VNPFGHLVDHEVDLPITATYKSTCGREAEVALCWKHIAFLDKLNETLALCPAPIFLDGNAEGLGNRSPGAGCKRTVDDQLDLRSRTGINGDHRLESVRSELVERQI